MLRRVGYPVAMIHSIVATPAALVEGETIHTGFFATPFRKVNLLDAPLMGGRWARGLRWLRLKEWNGFGVTHPRLYGGIIIQNAKFAGTGTIYLYDRETRKQYEWLVADLPHRVRLPETLWDGESVCERGGDSMRFRHRLAAGRHEIKAAIGAQGDSPAVAVDLVLHQDLASVEPLVVSLPIGASHHTYTHKSPLRLEGQIRIGATQHAFLPARDLGNLDEQKTFYPYRSHWWWGCFGVYTAAGRQVMLNFVDQMTPRELPGEDCLWVDGKLELLARPQITPEGGAYRIADAAGKLNLRFTPEGAKVEKRNFGVAAMDYAQMYGAYDGTLTDAAGRTHAIEKAFGALERMDARF
jgi:hypothetical protein